MAVTYEPIGTQTVSGTSTVTVSFTSIPSTYTDLVLVASFTESVDAVALLRFNSDTGANYSRTSLRGNGTTADTTISSGQTYINFAFGTLNSLTTVIWNIFDYANTTTFKSCVSRNNTTSDSLGATVGLWRSTSAITTVSYTANSGYVVAGSTFALYGIKAA